MNHHEVVFASVSVLTAADSLCLTLSLTSLGLRSAAGFLGFTAFLLVSAALYSSVAICDKVLAVDHYIHKHHTDGL